MRKKEIERTRKRLEKDRKKLLDDIERIRSKENEYLNNTVGDNIDQASSEYHRERLFYLSGRARNKLDAIEDSLMKIDEGRYGICEKCGKKITDNRLKAIPYARLCIKCKSRNTINI